MGKKDVVSKIYLGAADRIADLLNNELFEGGSAVAASDVMELDSTAASTLKEEDNIVNVRVVAKDLVRKVRFGIQVMLFAIEEQSDIHYVSAMQESGTGRALLCLKEMMDLSTLPEEVREKIADYPIHLIDVRRYPHAERFRTDLKLVFGFCSARQNLKN